MKLASYLIKLPESLLPLILIPGAASINPNPKSFLPLCIIWRQGLEAFPVSDARSGIIGAGLCYKPTPVCHKLAVPLSQRKSLNVILIWAVFKMLTASSWRTVKIKVTAVNPLVEFLHILR